MTCREQAKALCEMYGILSVLVEVQHYAEQHAKELDAEPLKQDAAACRDLVNALDDTFAAAGRIQN